MGKEYTTAVVYIEGEVKFLFSYSIIWQIRWYSKTVVFKNTKKGGEQFKQTH